MTSCGQGGARLLLDSVSTLATEGPSITLGGRQWLLKVRCLQTICASNLEASACAWALSPACRPCKTQMTGFGGSGIRSRWSSGAPELVGIACRPVVSIGYVVRQPDRLFPRLKGALKQQVESGCSMCRVHQLRVSILPYRSDANGKDARAANDATHFACRAVHDGLIWQSQIGVNFSVQLARSL